MSHQKPERNRFHTYVSHNRNQRITSFKFFFFSRSFGFCDAFRIFEKPQLKTQPKHRARKVANKWRENEQVVRRLHCFQMGERCEGRLLGDLDAVIRSGRETSLLWSVKADRGWCRARATEGRPWPLPCWPSPPQLPGSSGCSPAGSWWPKLPTGWCLDQRQSGPTGTHVLRRLHQ